MRKNKRKSKAMSVSAARTCQMAGVLVILLVAVIFNVIAKNQVTAVQKEIGEKQKVLAKLDEERIRVEAAWEGMKVNSSLERALRSHGLKMDTPGAFQTVRMDANGIPLKGQYSVAKALKVKARNVASR